MVISYLKRHEIATISYPLMDTRIAFSGGTECLGLNNSLPPREIVPLYIHIPFCERICKFCIYKREVPDKGRKIIESYVNALIKEIKMYSKSYYIKNIKVGAVFIGGGSPSCLTAEQIAVLLKAVKDNMPLHPEAEITFECSQHNTDEQKIKVLEEMGVTRISSGVQTFHQEHRKRLGLGTSSQQVHEWLAMLKPYNFADKAIDIIYGLPGQSVEEMLEDLSTALSRGITHLSLYKLAVFSDSQLYKELNDRRIPQLPDEDLIYEMYCRADSFLLNNNFYSQTVDEYSAQNKKVLFWELVNDGIGDSVVFGCSSLGYINGYSYRNEPDIGKYIQTVNQGCLPVKMMSRKITGEQLKERFCLISVRRNFIDKTLYQNYFADKIENQFGALLEDLINKGLMKEKENSFALTQRGRYYQGNISLNFMQSSFKNVSPYRKKLAIGMHVHPEAL